MELLLLAVAEMKEHPPLLKRQKVCLWYPIVYVCVCVCVYVCVRVRVCVYMCVRAPAFALARCVYACAGLVTYDGIIITLRLHTGFGRDLSLFKKAQAPVPRLASPLRTQSPLKRFNKVAPLEPKPSVSDQPGKLRCKSESSLYEAVPLVGEGGGEEGSGRMPGSKVRALPPPPSLPPPSPPPPPPLEPTIIVVETSKLGKAKQSKGMAWGLEQRYDMGTRANVWHGD